LTHGPPIHRYNETIVGSYQLKIRARQKGFNVSNIIGVNMLLLHLPGKSPIERPGIKVSIVKTIRQAFGNRTFSDPGRTVNGND
jgi:hypothetical protein